MSVLLGYDHAGIASQVVAERALSQNGQTRQSMGREKFLDYMETFAETSSNNIRQQIKRIGASVSWSFNAYTMSSSYSFAVAEAFRLLFNQGLIKRKPDLVRWSPTLQSVISDSEVFMKTIGPGKNSFTEMGKNIESKLFGLMFHIKYKVSNGEFVTVATSRPETMFADVALCVNPNDSRYSSLIGQYAINPVDNRKLVIYADDKVAVDFGTGVMKLTPSHNTTDDEICSRIGIKMDRELREGMYDNECKLNKLCGKFEGLNRFEAREQVVNMLTEANQIEQIEERSSFLPFCVRSGDLLEFFNKDQWFLDTNILLSKWKNEILEVVSVDNSGAMQKAIDKEASFNWCLSRQIWWGHQVPAYKVIINDQEKGNFSNHCAFEKESA